MAAAAAAFFLLLLFAASSSAAVNARAVADNVTPSSPPPPPSSGHDTRTPKQVYCEFRKLAMSVNWENATLGETAAYVTLHSLVRYNGLIEKLRNPGSLHTNFDCGLAADNNFNWTDSEEMEIMAALSLMRYSTLN